MSNATNNLAVFKGVINDTSIRNRIKVSMGDNAGAFIASMLDLYEGEATLQKCDPQKVAMECLKAASLNLPIVKSLGFAYVVPYGSTPTFIIGYKGMIQLFLRSGQCKVLNADAVYEGERIQGNRITGAMNIVGEKKSDKVIGYFAYFQLVNGYEHFLYMTVEELKAYGKKYSKAYNNGPWQTNFEEMAKKTLLRRIMKYAPMETQMQVQKAEKMEAESLENAARADEAANANKGQVIDAEGYIVDESTGEVLSEPEEDPETMPEEEPEGDDEQAAMWPEEPGF